MDILKNRAYITEIISELEENVGKISQNEAQIKDPKRNKNEKDPSHNSQKYKLPRGRNLITNFTKSR